MTRELLCCNCSIIFTMPLILLSLPNLTSGMSTLIVVLGKESLVMLMVMSLALILATKIFQAAFTPYAISIVFNTLILPETTLIPLCFPMVFTNSKI
ncbi:hypothetical protein Gotur_026711 [Gossypium turneri]